MLWMKLLGPHYWEKYLLILVEKIMRCLSGYTTWLYTYCVTFVNFNMVYLVFMKWIGLFFQNRVVL